MSKCEISIVLDDEKYRYEPNEIIRGEVRVEVNDDCKCKALTLFLSWNTHGRGNVDKEKFPAVTLFSGQWHGAQSYSYPFEIHAPSTPLTYRGNYLNVDWHLNCRADIPWAIDPKGVEEIVVAPSDSEQLSTTDTRDGPAIGAGHVSKAPLLVGVFAFYWCGMVLWMDIGVVTVLMFLFGLGFAFAALYPFFRRLISGAILGDVSAEIDETGGEKSRLCCKLRLSRKQRQKLTSARGSLKVYEKVVYGSGTDKQTYTHDLWDSPGTFQLDASPKSADPYGRGVAEGEADHDVLVAYFSQPDAALPSFSSGSNDLVWEVKLHLDLPNAPDWLHTIPLNRSLSVTK